jgi:hypothetical protein
MLDKNPQSLGKSIEVKAGNRPIKIAYLVPIVESPLSHLILDAVFHESYTRWAGTSTLIVPTDSDKFLDDRYEGWLGFFDPDFICTYVEIEEDFQRKIDRLCQPIVFVLKSIEDEPPEETRWRSLAYDWTLHFTPVSSISTICSPNIYHRSFLEKDSELTIVTQYMEPQENRFFSDNFGTSFHFGSPTYGIAGLFETLSLVPSDFPDHTMSGDVHCTSIMEILNAINERKAVPISRFAMLHSEAVPNINAYNWSNSFNIFIGNSILDRIHFWNARHFTPTHAKSLGAMIFDKEFFEDPENIKLIGEYLNKNNFLGQDSGPAKAYLRSYSYSAEELDSIRDTLDTHTFNFVTCNRNIDDPAIPVPDNLDRSYFRGATDITTFKLNEDINTISATDPDFFQFIPPRFKGISRGEWIVDLDIQRHNDLSKYINRVDKWVLPRKLQIVRAFSNGLGKVTSFGQLSLLIDRKMMWSSKNGHKVKQLRFL